ncbi:hypothetical protein [Thermoleptolyngbya sp.]
MQDWNEIRQREQRLEGMIRLSIRVMIGTAIVVVLIQFAPAILAIARFLSHRTL